MSQLGIFRILRIFFALRFGIVKISPGLFSIANNAVNSRNDLSLE